jgi:hypothetical protein
MSRINLVAFTLLALVATSSSAVGALIMSFSSTAPFPDAFDQFNFLDSATVPGGMTPGGGTYNSQAYSDNSGPPGQTFTTPGSFSASMPNYRLQTVSLKGANTGGGNLGGISGTTTWGIRISEVNGTNLVPVQTVTGIPSTTGMTGNEWFTWTFTDADRPTLLNSKQYAFEVFSSAGYLGFDAQQSDTNYALGTAFNSLGPARSFTDNTTGNLANHGYDRTFVVGLDPIPEPAGAILAIGGLVGLLAVRRRSAS